MKKVFLSAIAMVFLAGCGQSPEEVVKSYVDSVGCKGDIEKGASLVYLSESQMKDEATKRKVESKLDSMSGTTTRDAMRRGGCKTIEITDKNIGKDAGRMKVKITFGDGTTEELDARVRKNHQGDWKVVWR
ncbi:DUF4878 domain-containing protein [Campylobacter sp. VBCF_05 NA6]|uniref:DUF4878 domain-containing protein n=1 Tax=unclassified Campylobacter TaxID=2593542 RepID=UPI0022E9B3C4|nr:MULTISPECIES: DUF4878 domain-containing protein [unclassified Campylobacter]MDA3057817.1 DUF4878 domain-containing protein [Campylobacter sp. VBCF_04 NA7]MDA3058809.1 DUF4878 domain-containing protein [Campylobacter sp. VBCF_05 NA6]